MSQDKKKGIIRGQLDDFTGSFTGVSMPAGEAAEKFVDDLHESRKQQARAKKKRTLTAALAVELRQSPDWRSQLPARVGTSTTISEYLVTMQVDGRYVIRNTATNKTTTVKLESIAKKIRT